MAKNGKNRHAPKRDDAPDLTIYTDGSCKPNPGPGGYAVVAEINGKFKVVASGSATETTNNRMEITAVSRALEVIIDMAVRAKKNGQHLITATVYCDSTYVVNSISKGWVYRWQMANWWVGTHGKRSPVKNADLWKAVVKKLSSVSAAGVKLSVEHVKGHNGNNGNVLADRVANGKADEAKRALKTGWQDA